MPPLLLDDDEAVAIVIGLRTAGDPGSPLIDEASARALAKLEQVLPPGFERGRGGAAATTPIDWSRGPSVDPAVLMVVAWPSAVRTGCDSPTGRRTERPDDGRSSHAHWSSSRRWYLVARDEDRD